MQPFQIGSLVYLFKYHSGRTASFCSSNFAEHGSVGLQPFPDWQLGSHGSTPLRQDLYQEATVGEAEIPIQSLSSTPKHSPRVIAPVLLSVDLPEVMKLLRCDLPALDNSQDYSIGKCLKWKTLILGVTFCSVAMFRFAGLPEVMILLRCEVSDLAYNRSWRIIRCLKWKTNSSGDCSSIVAMLLCSDAVLARSAELFITCALICQPWIANCGKADCVVICLWLKSQQLHTDIVSAQIRSERERLV